MAVSMSAKTASTRLVIVETMLEEQYWSPARRRAVSASAAGGRAADAHSEQVGGVP
jgi:hypothetical protein